MPSEDDDLLEITHEMLAEPDAKPPPPKRPPPPPPSPLPTPPPLPLQVNLLGDGQEVQLDWLADLVIPACVFGLLGSLLYFLIDLRQYLAGGEASILRYVVFWFLVGVIGLSRMSARPGSSTVPPEMYMLVLGGAVVLVVLELSGLQGSFVQGGHSRPGLALLLNLMTVAGIWVAAWMLTGLCTRLEHMLEKMQGGDEAALPTRGRSIAAPARAILVVSAIAVAIFGYGLAEVSADNPLRKHAYVCAGLYLLFAMLLMALVNLGAARVAAQAAKLRVRKRAVSAWVAGAGMLALVVILVAAILPGARSRLTPRQAAVAAAAHNGPQSWGHGTRRGTSSQPGSSPGGKPANSGAAHAKGGQKPQLGGTLDRMAQALSGAMQIIEQALATPLRWLLWLLIALAVLAALAAMWWQRRRLLALLMAFAALIEQVFGWLGRIMPRRRPRTDGLVELPRDPWADIFTVGDPSRLDPGLAVRHVWRATELFYNAAGGGRHDGETELEFARRATSRLGVTRENVRRLAGLYSECEYGQQTPPHEIVPELAELWGRITAAARAAQAAQRRTT